MGCRIVGAGSALPRRVVGNDELSRIVDTSDEWIVERTGIRERRVAVEETSTDLAADAAERALRAAGVAAAEVDLVICMTITPDAVIPSQASLLKARLGLGRAVAFDLNAACTGCIYGMDVASSMMEASALAAEQAASRGGVPRRNVTRRALVVGVERLSRLVDWTDRSTCVLFGDGAGAAVLAWDDSPAGIKASFLQNTDDADLLLSCGALYDTTSFPFGDPEAPYRRGGDQGEAVRADLQTDPHIGMQGPRVFKFASSAMAQAVVEVCRRAGVALDDVDCIVAHQANERIIKFASKKLGVPLDRFQVSIAHTGNTSASSVLIALADAYESERIAPGDVVVLVGFGGGLTSGALLFEA